MVAATAAPSLFFRDGGDIGSREETGLLLADLRTVLRAGGLPVVPRDGRGVARGSEKAENAAIGRKLFKSLNFVSQPKPVPPRPHLYDFPEVDGATPLPSAEQKFCDEDSFPALTMTNARAPICIVGEPRAPHMATAKALTTSLCLITSGGGLATFPQACLDLGLGPAHMLTVEDDATLHNVSAAAIPTAPWHGVVSAPNAIRWLADNVHGMATPDVIVHSYTGAQNDFCMVEAGASDPLIRWAATMSNLTESALSTGARAAIYCIPYPARHAQQHPVIAWLQTKTPTQWSSTAFPLSNVDHGGYIATHHWVILAAAPKVIEQWTPPAPCTEGPQGIDQVLDGKMPEEAQFLLLNNFDVRPNRHKAPPPNVPHPLGWIRERGTTEWHEFHGSSHPAPQITDNEDNPFGEASFGMQEHNDVMETVIRAATPTEVLSLLGLHDGAYEVGCKRVPGNITLRTPAIMEIHAAWALAASLWAVIGHPARP